ncbi:MAG: hypothetical protein EBX40_02015 [Gammaproteobacteria bacterium]|jgi:hypothetical protein|nr:hypothetical protein [Gammaproteobacteria bacterium]
MNKPDVKEQKIEITDNNTHKKVFSLTYTQGEIVKPTGLDADQYEWAGAITSHCYIKHDMTGSQIVGVQFVNVPFLSQLPENAASMMLDQIRKDMKEQYGKKDKGIQ